MRNDIPSECCSDRYAVRDDEGGRKTHLILFSFFYKLKSFQKNPALRNVLQCRTFSFHFELGVFNFAMKSFFLAVTCTHAGRKPLRIALRAEAILDQAQQ